MNPGSLSAAREKEVSIYVDSPANELAEDIDAPMA
jgi:hypothetical protein